MIATKKSEDINVEQKLRSLYQLQLIDTKIDTLKNLRGELPLEISDLKDEIEGLLTRSSKIAAQLMDQKNKISEYTKNILEGENILEKRKKEINNIKNSREYDELKKNIEFHDLDNQLFKKKKGELETSSKVLEVSIQEIDKTIETRNQHLFNKEKELNDIVAETQKEENFLNKKAQKIEINVDARNIKIYKKLRASFKNGLAIVPIERGAALGSFFEIPPQIQMDVAMRRSIILDEHSGRILVDAQLAFEEKEKMEQLLYKK